MTNVSNKRKDLEMMRFNLSVGSKGVETGRRPSAKLLLIAALVAATAALVVPAMASADARVSTDVPCVAYANSGATFYSGSGTSVITDGGNVVTSCHLTLAFGTAVTQPTRTAYGNCTLLQLPSGNAELRCHYSLL